MSNENNIKAPVFPYDKIRNHPSLEIPIPIEEIVESQMGINIVTIPIYISFDFCHQKCL